MSFSTFYLVQLSNDHYMEHLMRTPPTATEERNNLPYHVNRRSPCEHNLTTPCPLSTPILIQHTNSGLNRYVQVQQGPADNLLRELHTDLLYRTAINILNSLNKSPAVEAISPIKGSRHDHSFYICQLCYPRITHIMNIGATLHHITHHHKRDRYEHRDKLTQEAAGHLAEIRYLLQQTNDRRVFTLVRSSSDSLPITTWRGNSANSDIESITMDGRRASTPGHPPKTQQTPITRSLTGPPTYRNVKVNQDPTDAMSMINAGLSLNLSNTSSRSTSRLEYAERLTGSVDTPERNTKKKGTETHQTATSTPITRNGGVRQGIFDKGHNFRRFHS